MSQLISLLESVLPYDVIHTDAALIRRLSQDVFSDGVEVGAVVKPVSESQVLALVQLCKTESIPLIGRGGGMSYTSGYLATKPDSVLIDTSNMNRILEINTVDATVTVEPGVTWETLHKALAEKNLRTPFWGTLSGRYATVGGGLSQNGVFWGSGYHGSAGDNVLSLRVVTGRGEVIETGSASQRNSTAFSTYFGPDLTGLFVGDGGAYGIKVSATLPLLPAAEAKSFTAFAFDNSDDMTLAMSEISRRALASECFGFDPYLQKQRMKRASLTEDVQQLGGVIKAEKTLIGKVKQATKVAVAGRSFMDDVAWSFSTISEGRTQAEADVQAAEIRSICKRYKGYELPDSIPRLVSANPFGPVNNMVGPEGERWLPVHALLPHSKAQLGIECIESVFKAHEATMQNFSIHTGYLITTVGQQVSLLEPVLFWPDELNDLHKHSLEPDHLARLNQFDAVPGAFEAVTEIKGALVLALSDLGSAHFQLGKAYLYQEGLKPEAAAVLNLLKAHFDPQGIMNPGVLGFN
jgi:FAD/FMN-containing dehydrogenase